MFEKFIPKQYLPIMMLVDVAGVLVQEMKAKDDQILEELVQMELDRAKDKGLDAVRKFANSYKYSDEFQWKILYTPDSTAAKLVSGSFKTMKELENDIYEVGDDFENEVQILYREMYNEHKEDYVHIIETIFINE